MKQLNISFPLPKRQKHLFLSNLYRPYSLCVQTILSFLYFPLEKFGFLLTSKFNGTFMYNRHFRGKWHDGVSYE